MGHKIFIVDDAVDFVELLLFDIRRKGYEIETATNGEEALEKLKTLKPDLIIFDIKMPKMDGYTFLKNVKKDPTLNNTPMIALTSYEPMKEMFAMEGVSDYFVKSADMAPLFARLEELVPPPA